MGPEERLAAHLKEGLACLRRGDPGRALLHLRPVVDDEALASSPDLVDIRARALALLAQALIQAPVPEGGDGLAPLDEAESHLDAAESLDAGAAEGTASLREELLDARTARLEASARAARTARLASTDIEPLLARVRDPSRRLDLLLHKAQAELDARRPDAAVSFAQRVLDAGSDDPRHPVMALLTLAAALPDQSAQHVRRAYDLAEGASEFNLVATVARTAELLAVELPRLEGPQRAPSPGVS